MKASKYLKLDYYNGRNIIATPTRNDFTITTLNNEILEINLNNEPLLQQGDELEITQEEIKYKYKTASIIELVDRSFLIQECACNKCNYFVLPIVANVTNEVRDSKYLYNTYLSKNLDRYYMIFRFSKDIEYLQLEEKLTKLKNFRKSTEVEGDSKVIFEFDCSKYRGFLNKFINGKYSKFTIADKRRIDAFNGLKDISDIIYQKESRRLQMGLKLGLELSVDSELASIPGEREYYDYFINTNTK